MKHRRAGITLYQLLLVLAVLARLFAILLPALTRARAEALRQQKLNNLKQIGLAMHIYHDANNFFPPGNDKFNFSVAAKILPYVEQDALYRQLDLEKPIDDPKNAKVAATTVKTFLSPNDPRMGVKPNLGATNYLFNAGSQPGLEKNDGIFFQDSKIRFANITDGTSNTLFSAETLKGDGGDKAQDVKRQHVLLGQDALKDVKDETGAAEWKVGKNIAGDRCASWMDGRFLIGTFTATRKLNDERPDVSCGGAGGLSSLRSPDRIIGVGFADGSVRTVKDGIDLEVWKLLWSANDGTVLTDF